MATRQATRQAITLKGSTALVTEFFKYAVNTYVHLLQSINLCSNRSYFEQHLVPTRSVSFRRLPHGQEIWANSIGNSRPCTGKLSRQVNKICVCWFNVDYCEQDPQTSAEYVATQWY